MDINTQGYLINYSRYRENGTDTANVRGCRMGYVCRKSPSTFPVKNELGISHAKIEGRFTSPFFINRVYSLNGLNHQGAGTATTVTDADAAKLATLGAQDTEKGRHNAGTTGTERVSNGDRTTVNVDLVLGETKKLQIGKSHNTEGLVDLKGIDGVLGHTGVLQGLGDSQSRSSGELAGLMRSVTPTQDLGNRLEAELLHLSLGNQNNGGGTVVQGRRVGGGHGSSAGNKGRLHGAELLRVEL